jgi:putative DNA-invertase from lambdoid prophage Rac
MAKKAELGSGLNYIYGRVSTDMQESSREIQMETCKKYISYRLGGLVQDAFYDTDVSGSIKLGDRPQGSKMIDILRPGDNVVISKLDRGFRSTLDICEFIDYAERQSIALHVCDFLGGAVDLSTAHGKFIIKIMVAAYELERSNIVARITAGSRRLAAMGAWRAPEGYNPIGFKYVKIGERKTNAGNIRPLWAKVPDRDQDFMFEELAKAVSQSKCSNEMAAEILNGRGIQPPSGGWWTKTKVKNARVAYKLYLAAVEEEDELNRTQRSRITRHPDGGTGPGETVHPKQ